MRPSSLKGHLLYLFDQLINPTTMTPNETTDQIAAIFEQQDCLSTLLSIACDGENRLHSSHAAISLKYYMTINGSSLERREILGILDAIGSRLLQVDDDELFGSLMVPFSFSFRLLGSSMAFLEEYTSKSLNTATPRRVTSIVSSVLAELRQINFQNTDGSISDLLYKNIQEANPDMLKDTLDSFVYLYLLHPVYFEGRVTQFKNALTSALTRSLETGQINTSLTFFKILSNLEDQTAIFIDPDSALPVIHASFIETQAPYDFYLWMFSFELYLIEDPSYLMEHTRFIIDLIPFIINDMIASCQEYYTDLSDLILRALQAIPKSQAYNFINTEVQRIEHLGDQPRLLIFIKAAIERCPELLSEHCDKIAHFTFNSFIGGHRQIGLEVMKCLCLNLKGTSIFARILASLIEIAEQTPEIEFIELIPYVVSVTGTSEDALISCLEIFYKNMETAGSYQVATILLAFIHGVVKHCAGFSGELAEELINYHIKLIYQPDSLKSDLTEAVFVNLVALCTYTWDISESDVLTVFGILLDFLKSSDERLASAAVIAYSEMVSIHFSVLGTEPIKALEFLLNNAIVDANSLVFSDENGIDGRWQVDHVLVPSIEALAVLLKKCPNIAEVKGVRNYINGVISLHLRCAIDEVVTAVLGLYNVSLENACSELCLGEKLVHLLIQRFLAEHQCVVIEYFVSTLRNICVLSSISTLLKSERLIFEHTLRIICESVNSRTDESSIPKSTLENLWAFLSFLYLKADSATQEQLFAEHSTLITKFAYSRDETMRNLALNVFATLINKENLQKAVQMVDVSYLLSLLDNTHDKTDIYVFLSTLVDHELPFEPSVFEYLLKREDSMENSGFWALVASIHFTHPRQFVEFSLVKHVFFSYDPDQYPTFNEIIFSMIISCLHESDDEYRLLYCRYVTRILDRPLATISNMRISDRILSLMLKSYINHNLSEQDPSPSMRYLLNKFSIQPDNN